jgi:ABC-type multidrug transport system fused ATPase/permease subunit
VRGITLLPLFGLTRGRILLFTGLSLGAALLEGFGMAMFLPVLQYAEKGQDAAQLAAASAMWERLMLAYDFMGVGINLLSLLAVAVGLMMLRVVGVYFRDVYAAWLSQEIQHLTRSTLFEAYMAMTYGVFAGQSSGNLINVLTTETQRAVGSFKALFALTANIAVVTGYVIVLLWISLPLTFLAVTFLAVSGAIVAFYVRNTKRYSHATTDANGQYSRIVLERLGAFRLLKLTSTSANEALRVREASRNVRAALYRMSRIAAGVALIMEPMALLSGGVILYIAIGEFGMSLSEVGIFVMILLRLLPLAKEIMGSRQTYHACVGSLAAVADSHSKALLAREAKGGDKPFSGVKVSIRFENVTFYYPAASLPALSRVDLTIPAGKVTALVGPSGSGKSTLADVISRLCIPQEGRVLYDEVDGAAFDLASLRRGMSFVSQDATVLNDTVAGNLRLVRPDATEADLWEALTGAQAASFVRSLDQGIETRLGERGIRLSGGQKQRLSLARALLQKTRLLILDEPTSALDSEIERDIQQTLDELRATGNTTIVIIAHRFSTIRDADQIAVVMGGQVTQQGSHEQLMLSEDWYAKATGLQVE